MDYFSDNNDDEEEDESIWITQKDPIQKTIPSIPLVQQIIEEEEEEEQNNPFFLTEEYRILLKESHSLASNFTPIATIDDLGFYPDKGKPTLGDLLGIIIHVSCIYMYYYL
jgi:hypothetical protein